jgi:copper chaperone
VANIRIAVKGMTCNHCRARVENAVKAVAGVFAVYVDLTGGYAEVDFSEGKTTGSDLVAAIKASGYEAEITE